MTPLLLVLVILESLIAFALGSVMGSFLLVVSSRMSVRTLGGRSKCDACATQLTWKDLVPVVSYVALRGRCRTCQVRIPRNALVIEVIMGLVFMIHSLVAPDPITLVAGLVVFSLCCVLALYDAKSQFLPANFLWALVAVALIYRVLAVFEIGIVHTVLGFLWVLIPAALLLCLNVFSRGRWMGAGDPLLLLGLSLVIGTWQGALFTLLFASWIGLLYVIILGVVQHKTHQDKGTSVLTGTLAFGPCLIAGFVLAWWMSLLGLLVFV